MKLSESTVTFLKNYATINQSLEFREGDTLKTVSPLNTILASVKITENFPRNFQSELNRFLGISIYLIVLNLNSVKSVKISDEDM